VFDEGFNLSGSDYAHCEQFCFGYVVDVDRILLVIGDYALFFLCLIRGLLCADYVGEEPTNKNELFQVFFLETSS
jgi:hypothetical protein